MGLFGFAKRREKRECPQCQGRKMVPCHRCGGQKILSIPNRTIDCYECNLTGIEVCGMCEGKGWIYEPSPK